MVSVAGLAVLGMTATLAAVQTNGAMAQTPDAGCALPSEPEGIPAALDAAISGPADKDRACMKALLIPEARMMFVSLGADGTPSYRLETFAGQPLRQSFNAAFYIGCLASGAIIVGTDRRTFAVISLWGKFGGFHACAATFPYIVPLPNIFITRLFQN